MAFDSNANRTVESAVTNQVGLYSWPHMMQNVLQIIWTWMFRIGWIEIAQGAKTAAMTNVHAPKMRSASTSMMTKPAASMRPNRTNAQPSLGGMKIWLQLELGTKPFNSVRGFDNRVQMWFNFP